MSEKNNLVKKIVIAIIIAVAVGVGVSFMTDQKSETAKNPKTVFWIHVHGLGIDPSDRDTLYIATHGDFYKSVNAGPPVKVDKKRADYMAFNAPYSEGTPLYASGHPSTGGNMGLVKSTDGGQTWETVATILEPPVDFHAMAIGKSDPQIIIGFDSGGRGLFKTIDAGMTWKKMEPPEYVSALAISTNDSDLIFAGTGNGVFVSIDGANTWRQLEQHKGSLVHAMTFDENNVIYASIDRFGFLRSPDLGQNWQKINTPDLTITSIAIDAQNNILYVAGYSPEGFQEVHFSNDDGHAWNLIGTNEDL